MIDKPWKIFLTISFLSLVGLFEYLRTHQELKPQVASTTMDFKGFDFQPYSRKNSDNEQSFKNNEKNRFARFKQREQRNLQAGILPPVKKNEELNQSNNDLNTDEANEKLLKGMADKATAQLEKEKSSKKKLEEKQKLAKEKLKKKKEKEEKDKLNAKNDEINKSNDELIDENNNRPKESANLQTGHTTVVTQDPQQENNQNKEDENTKTLEEWISLLLKEPNKKLNNEFIHEYQTGRVSADIFYAVIEHMLQDNRQSMKELAIISLDSNPSLKSFSILSHINQEEAYESPVRSLSIKAMGNYTQVNQLGILMTVIQSNEPLPTRESALLILIDSARINLVDRTISSNPTTPSDPNQVKELRSNEEVLDRYVSIITSLEQILLKQDEASIPLQPVVQSTIDNLKSIVKT